LRHNLVLDFFLEQQAGQALTPPWCDTSYRRRLVVHDLSWTFSSSIQKPTRINNNFPWIDINLWEYTINGVIRLIVMNLMHDMYTSLEPSALASSRSSLFSESAAVFLVICKVISGDTCLTNHI
jgi:hypothetical protein